MTRWWNSCALVLAVVACDEQREQPEGPPPETVGAPEPTEEASPPEPRPNPDLELLAAAMGSVPRTQEEVRVYLAREVGEDGWPLLCTQATGDAAEAAANLPVGTLLSVTGQATETRDEYWHDPAERRCRIDAILERESGHSVHLPAGLGPLRGGMSRDQIAAALSVPPDDIPTDTDERVFVVAGWALVMDHDYLQFFGTDAARLSELETSEYDRTVNDRIDLARHTCSQPGWRGRLWRRYGWVENEATGTRILFASPGVKQSWYVSYVCGAARRLTREGGQGDERSGE